MSDMTKTTEMLIEGYAEHLDWLANRHERTAEERSASQDPYALTMRARELRKEATGLREYIVRRQPSGIAALDAAYEERNRVVAMLASMGRMLGWNVGIKLTAIEGWSPEWHNCVYIDTPVGQVSWHFHNRDRSLFEGLPLYTGEWDGHTTPEKYARLAQACAVMRDIWNIP